MTNPFRIMLFDLFERLGINDSSLVPTPSPRVPGLNRGGIGDGAIAQNLATMSTVARFLFVGLGRAIGEIFGG